MLRSLRNFIIMLCLSGVIFGFAAYYASGILVECLGPMFGITVNNSEQTDDIGDNENDDNKDSLGMTDTESFSMLIINTNYKPSQKSEYRPYDIERFPQNESVIQPSSASIKGKPIEATDFIILRGNALKNEYTYTYLPASLVLNVKGEEITLNEIYRDLGVTFLAKKISAITGFDINFWTVYDIEDIAKISNLLSGVYFNVPYDLTEGDKTLMSKGPQTVKADGAQLILEYSGYQNTAQRSNMIIGYIKAVMSKISNKINKIDILALHRAASSYVDSTLTVSTVNSLSNIIYSYNSSNVLEISYPGSYNESDKGVVFIPNIAAAISKFEPYR